MPGEDACPHADGVGTYRFYGMDGLFAAQLIGVHPSCDTVARAAADEMERRSGGSLLIVEIRRRDPDGWVTIQR
ncbi:hypothetical protein [Streptacidiphilus cavernicola]|uniref:Uncharacterized protein n=1 Tax=Streptacidiphilus cavernicola TaxID=3342716 RepID=A0ABV6VQG2_9ACTN